MFSTSFAYTDAYRQKHSIEDSNSVKNSPYLPPHHNTHTHIHEIKG